MAFYRGWLQGMPLADVADLYLETGLDLRRAKSTLAWIQDTLRRAALRHGKRGEARLLRLRIDDVRSNGGENAANAPPIDDFREEIDPTGFYSFDELMTRYLERYPQAGNEKARKRSRLIERQINTLNWLETLLVTEPVKADPVEAWLDPNIAGRLRRAGLATLGDVMERMATRGYRWFTTVPKFGERNAKRLTAWLQGYKDSLGDLPRQALVPAAQLRPRDKVRSLVLLSGPAQDTAAPPIVPLEAMLLPLRTTYPSAENAPRQEPKISATHDREAIDEWLNVQAGGASTRRAYRKEAERLVLWAMVERGVTLAQMTVGDCVAYRDWLCALGRTHEEEWPFRIPQAQWFAPRATKRHSPAWRPFEKELSGKSVLFALKVVNILFGWLVKVRYLDFNPWIVIDKPKPLAGDAPEGEFDRALTPAQWDYAVAAAASLEEPYARARARLLLSLAQGTGMRLSELADATYGRVYTKALKRSTGVRWMLNVLGKGAKWRVVPLNEDVLVRMRDDLELRGLGRDPKAVPEDTPIIARLDGSGGLSVAGVARTVKALFHMAEKRLFDEGKFEDAQVFRRASTHWIRHTTGSMLGDAGVPPSQIQQLLGHASIATTTIYTSTNEETLWESADVLRRKPAPTEP